MGSATYIRQMKGRSTDSVSELARLHRTELLRHLVRLTGRRAVSEEIAQQAFLQLYRRGLEDAVCARALLFDVARKLAVDHLRRRARADSVIVEGFGDVDVADESPGPDRIAMAEQAMLALSRVIDTLPRRLREIFVMRYVLNQSRAQIAAELHFSSVKAVEQRLTRAIALCRQRLLRRGHDWRGLD